MTLPLNQKFFSRGIFAGSMRVVPVGPLGYVCKYISIEGVGKTNQKEGAKRTFYHYTRVEICNDMAIIMNLIAMGSAILTMAMAIAQSGLSLV